MELRLREDWWCGGFSSKYSGFCSLSPNAHPTPLLCSTHLCLTDDTITYLSVIAYCVSSLPISLSALPASSLPVAATPKTQPEEPPQQEQLSLHPDQARGIQMMLEYGRWWTSPHAVLAPRVGDHFPESYWR